MKHLGVFVGAVMGLLVGCGPVGPEAQGTEAAEDQSTQAGVLSPEEVDALLARVQDQSDEVYQPLLVDACSMSPNVNGCFNAGYQSCGSWSNHTVCSTNPYCNHQGCRVWTCEDADCFYVYRGTQSQSRARYRVCFNAAQEACTEVERSTNTVCGCAE